MRAQFSASSVAGGLNVGNGETANDACVVYWFESATAQESAAWKSMYGAVADCTAAVFIADNPQCLQVSFERPGIGA